jgi:type II secretory pathway pseudopilin PulG
MNVKASQAIMVLLAAFSSPAGAVATSLTQSTPTVQVGQILSGVAVGAGINAINDSKIQAAIADVNAIGQAIRTFQQGNAFYPLYRYGNRTAATDPSFLLLVSESGTYPTDSSPAAAWRLPAASMQWAVGGIAFGQRPDAAHDSLEGQLQTNVLGNDPSQRYPLRGAYAGAPGRGWAGPYVNGLPKTDPWGNKYVVNVRDLPTGRVVLVLSAGPNRIIETSPEQSSASVSILGDDIAFRVQ